MRVYSIPFLAMTLALVFTLAVAATAQIQLSPPDDSAETNSGPANSKKAGEKEDQPLLVVASESSKSPLGLVLARSAKSETGLLVGHVLDKSAAKTAGVAKGDIVVAANGKLLNQPGDLDTVTQNARGVLELTILRSGNLKNVSVQLPAKPIQAAKLPPPPAVNAQDGSVEALPPPPVVNSGRTGQATLGATVVDVSSQTRSRYGQIVRRGAVVVQVRAGSPASLARLPLGAVIVAFDGQRVDSANDLVARVRASRAGREVELTFYRQRQLMRRTVRLEKAGYSAGALPERHRLTSPPQRPALGAIQDLVQGLNVAPIVPSEASQSLSVRRELIEVQQKLDWLTKRVVELEANLLEERKLRAKSAVRD